MKIGLRAHDLGRHSALDLCRIISGLSFNAVQLAVPKAIEGIDSYLSITDGQCDDIARAFSASGIEISVLGCYVEPSLTDREKRFAQLEIFFAALRVARIIGAPRVGTETTRFIYGCDARETVYAILRDSVLRMVEFAEKEGVDVAIEPVRDHTLNTPELTARLIRDVNSTRLSIIFDPVNLLTPDLVASQQSVWIDCMDSFGEKISAIHVKDVRLGLSGFYPCSLGSGLMDYTEIMDGLRRFGKEVPLLREEIRVDYAVADREFLGKLVSEN